MTFVWLELQSWTKVLGHVWVSGAFSNSHRSNPSPHPTNTVGRVFPEFFRVSTLYRVGEGRTARKFRKRCTVLRGNQEKYEYCSTVPRTFVQDCRFTLKVILFPESGEFFLFGIRNPTSDCVIQSLKSGIHSMESTIQDCFVSDSSPVVPLYLSLVVRGVWWEEGKRGRGTSFFFPFPSSPAPATRVSRRRLGTSQVLNYLTRGDLLVGGFGFMLDSYRPSEID